MKTPEIFDPNAPAVTMTEAAVRHFEKKLATQDGKIIRLSTETSGCTGYAYVLDFADGPEEGDEVLTPSDKITLSVAPDAVNILRGTEIDLVTEGINQVVKFNNPNVVAECGCGESFSVS
ncbi:iron-sulfur cluster assembly accessory protein [Aestuariicella sp. G3-2]|nr:iron-sulfur cluster assembly accessory protein [Aestuariicella albida]